MRLKATAGKGEAHGAVPVGWKIAFPSALWVVMMRLTGGRGEIWVSAGAEDDMMKGDTVALLGFVSYGGSTRMNSLSKLSWEIWRV